MNFCIKLNFFKKNTTGFKYTCRLYTQYAYNNLKQTNHLSHDRTCYTPIILLEKRLFFPVLQKNNNIPYKL